MEIEAYIREYEELIRDFLAEELAVEEFGQRFDQMFRAEGFILPEVDGPLELLFEALNIFEPAIRPEDEGPDRLNLISEATLRTIARHVLTELENIPRPVVEDERLRAQFEAWRNEEAQRSDGRLNT